MSDKSTAELLHEPRRLSEPLSDDEARKQVSRSTRRAFLLGGVAAAAGVFGWRWMSDETRDRLLRSRLEFNEKMGRFFYRPQRLAREYPASSISPPRVNGLEGMAEDIDLAKWTLAVGGLHGRADDLTLTLDDIKALPRTEMTVRLHCIEGWSIVVNWAGVRFSDFVATYLPRTVDASIRDMAARTETLPTYVGLWTPDAKYFVGWDMESIMHPQTLLAYEMNGAPLTREHGAPLRLASPTKYGIKLIKRIGRIEFMNVRPRDYWAENGYDWYAGL
jgi:DMSO/TMAO reductase YedYZ molybdopterin-dependent catalytic subunit